MINYIAQIQEKTAFYNFGITISDSSDAESDSSNDESVSFTNESPITEKTKTLLLSLILRSHLTGLKLY